MDETDGPKDVEMPLIEDRIMPTSLESNITAFNSNELHLPEVQVSDSRYENHAGTFTTGIDIFSKEEKLKMEERAIRFGLTDKVKSALSNQEQDLYASMGIVEENENTKHIRLNVIHMRGTEDMSTKDVFKYFEDYAPASIEWINDISCNVVWLDNVSAARALLGLSRKIIGLSPTSNNEKQSRTSDSVHEENNMPAVNTPMEIDEDNTCIDETENKKDGDNIDIKDIDYPLPPGIWRKGINYPKCKALFLRFATRADKKQLNAEKMSEYYRKYGNPNFGGIKGILTETRKRVYKQIKQTRRKSIDELSDESKNKKRMKNPWGALSEAWGYNDFVEDDFSVKTEHKDQGRSVKERLGIRLPTKEVESLDERSEHNSSNDSDEEWCKRSKVLRMRMHADDEEEKVQKRRAKLRSKMILHSLDKSTDLRARLGKPKQETQYRDAIQVVVTNLNATKTSIAKLGDSEEEDGEIVETTEGDDKEEGEWVESEKDKEKAQIQQEDESDEDSDVPAKEIQGPKGSVIKVVQHKPRVASTVWARLNHVKSEVIDNSFKERPSRSRSLRNTLKSGDLRSRIGNHTRGRSPLRIEVKNDKYAESSSDTE